jgi:UDP-glucose 4-epimerase
LAGKPGGAFNLGQGQGYSVLEVLHKTMAVTGKELPVETGPRRSGDAAVLVASNRKAREVLGWMPEHSSLENIIASAWRWHQRLRR